MRTRFLALVVLLTGLAAAAQELTPPPLVAPPLDAAPIVTPDVQSPPANSCAGPRDCANGFVCTGFQDLGDGKWSRGSCQPKNVRTRSAPGEPAGLTLRPDGRERFKYAGTVPSGFHLISQPRMKLVGGGIGALAGGHAAGIIMALVSLKPLGVIPIAGPIILAVQWWSPGGLLSGLSNFFTLLLCGVDLAAQVAGVVLLAVGLGQPEQWLERDAAKPTISFVPTAPGAPLGASLVGRF